MVVVRLNDWDEFIGELQSSPPTDRVVRLTLSIRFDQRTVPHLTMVAGYLSGQSIVEFIHYLGIRPASVEQTRTREIQELLDGRKKQLEALSLSVKPGRYHVAGPIR
jgi:hypothetical protein